METRANYIIVGIFTLATVLSAFAFVYWTAGIGDRGETAQIRFRIPGSASGLGRGSAVLFNGVRVGDVRSVYIDISNPSVAIADAVVDRATPITQSTQADVGLAGLTGQANIELRGGNPAEENLIDLAERQGQIAEILANPSAVSNLLETSQTILRRADAVLIELEEFARDSRGPLTETVRNVEEFSAALGRNAEGIDRFLDSVSSMSETLAGVSGRLDSTLAAGEELIRAVDPAQINQTVESIALFSQRLEQASAGFQEIMSGIDQSVDAISLFAETANSTLGRVDEIIAEVQPGAVTAAVTNFEQASVSVNAAAGDLSRLAAQLGGRSEDIDRIIDDAQEISQSLNRASNRVDGILVRVDDLLGSGEAEGLIADASATLDAYRELALTVNARVGGVLDSLESMLGSDEAEGLIAEAGETLRAYRMVADTLNARVGTITDGLSRFSGQGLREVESLIRDSRRSITRIERAVTDLERNPQRIITGGAGEVREFDGRTRR
jgi:phospholipid/cholesterol/gamma-HCH transport system substrate-binding protein